MASAPRPVFGEFGEDGREVIDEVRFGAEVAEMVVACSFRFRDCDGHFRPVVPVEGVTFEVGGANAFASKDLVEGVLDRGRSGAG